MLHCLFGLGLRADEPIFGLPVREALPIIDVEVSFRQAPPDLGNSSADLWYASTDNGGDGEPNLQVWRTAGGAYFRLLYEDGCEFTLNRQGSRVWVRGPAAATPEDLATYFLGPIMGFLLRLRGIICLHASAVAVGGRALAFLGAPGAGKSTTAAALAQRGFPVLTDDVTALREQAEEFYVLPGAPRLCLWPDSVQSLYGSPDALPRLTPEHAIDPAWDKRFLDLSREGYRFQAQPLPLAAIYILDTRRSDAGPAVDGVATGVGLMSLVAHTYKSELLEKEMRAGEFELLGRLVERVPIRRVTPHEDPAYLPQLLNLILDDFQTLLTTLGN